jgi:hypothetical protein
MTAINFVLAPNPRGNAKHARAAIAKYISARHKVAAREPKIPEWPGRSHPAAAFALEGSGSSA